MTAVYELSQPRAPRSRRLSRRIALAAVMLALLLAWSPSHGPHDGDLVRPAEVGAGARDVALEDGSHVSELSAPQLLSARIEHEAGGVVLSFELERAVPHWLERNPSGGEVELILESLRLAQPLEWLDFADTPIRYLDIRRVGDSLHLALGLDLAAPVDVQSAMLDLSAGARLVVQVVARPELAAPLVSKRAIGSSGQDSYREALRLERAGEKAQSRGVLRALLARYPGHAQARTRLVEGLAAAGRPAEALRVLRAGATSKTKTNPKRAKLEARLLVEQRADAEAIVVLERALPAAAGDPEYQAFLGALLQRDGSHERALALFQAAVVEEPGRADWWLGRAISEDAQGERAAALTSLERALALGSLEPEPRQWAEARARSLAAEAAETKP